MDHEPNQRLTCYALEWVKIPGGCQMVEADRTISGNNAAAVATIDLAGTEVGKISPVGVIGY